MTAMAALTRDAIDLSSLQGRAAADGALCLFVGVVRDHHQGRPVLRLEYEAYEEMALPLMQRIEDEAKSRWPVSAVRIVHRLGPLEIGEASVAVAVLSAHREEAFAACHWAIDTLKATVPIWKKEYGPDGAVWMEGPGTCSPDPAALERPGRP
jgi:molybdopterin synthase catalytic subunit